MSLQIPRIVVTAIIIGSLCSIENNFRGTPTALAQPVPDGKGVIMFKYKETKRTVYNPLILASWGISYFTKYESTGDNKSKEYFINTANWLAANAKDKQGGKYSIWEYDFTWPWYYGVTPPYYSAYEQAVGVFFLANDYYLNKK